MTQRERATSDGTLVDALRAGDEQAFVQLVERYQGSLVRTAMAYVRERDVAEEVVQEAWLAVIRGIDRFEGRSSLATWIFQIVTNRARTRAVRERRTIPLSTFEPGPDGPSVDPARFRPEGVFEAGHWATKPLSWGPDASERLLSHELQGIIATAIEQLPDPHRTVITLRDIRGLSSDEVCAALQITAGNQRVILHRARTRVRAALETYLATADVM